jgi:hypothetical protein
VFYSEGMDEMRPPRKWPAYTVAVISLVIGGLAMLLLLLMIGAAGVVF